MTRHLVDVVDCGVDEISRILDLSEEPIAELGAPLAGLGAALIFEKPSNRTRHSMEMAVVQLGGHPVYTRGEEIGFDTREPVEDVIRIMDGYHAVVAARVFAHSTITRLAGAADAPLATWLASEHPQVVSVVLARLRSAQAARLLERFEAVFAHEVVLRMARAPNPDQAADAILKSIIERDFVSVMERNHGARKPAERIAALLNHVSRASRDSMLEKMEEDDPKLALEVQRGMFTFADIASRVPPRDIAALVKAVDEVELLTALKSAAATDDPAVEFILGNVTRRLADRLRDDLEGLPDVSAKEGEAAQTEIVNTIQQMVRRGEMKLIELDSTED